MLTPSETGIIAAGLSGFFGSAGALRQLEPVRGGDINLNYRADFAARPVFLKINRSNDALPRFRAEADALDLLRQQAELWIPQTYAIGALDAGAFLALEFLPLNGLRTATAWRALGTGLANLHRQGTGDRLAAPTYGWPADNFIGATPQVNSPRVRWCDFWWECRIEPQLRRACAGGFGEKLGAVSAPLEEKIHTLLGGYQPTPALLHGDLWSGNIGFCPDGRIALFDPASYYGDRETDLAMTELFGGFPREFYRAYATEWPLEAGAAARVSLYNLYHLLNHLNLFGAAYLPPCVDALNALNTLDTSTL